MPFKKMFLLSVLFLVPWLVHKNRVKKDTIVLRFILEGSSCKSEVSTRRVETIKPGKASSSWAVHLNHVGDF